MNACLPPPVLARREVLQRCGAGFGLAGLALMLGQGGGRAPMTRAGLESLEKAYPDEQKESGHD